MKFYSFAFLIIFLCSLTGTFQQNLLSNNEMKEILKCFGNLDLEEGCVICRYITQKICKYNFLIIK